jgi:hypothetical protein
MKRPYRRIAMIVLRKTLKFFAATAAAIAVALSIRAEPPAAPRISDLTLPIACEAATQSTFDLAFALLQAHVFPLAARAFDEVLRRDSACAMGYWGVALVRMDDLRSSGPSARQLAEGAAAAARAKALGGKTEYECDLIDAIAEYYHRHDERDHATRLLQYERALRKALERSPGDVNIRTMHSRAFEALTTH